MTRIVIIGAGLIGATLAWKLARAGARVTVFEAALHPASQASGRSFGWINASFHLGAAHHRLRVAGIAAHHRLARDLEGVAWDWPGCLWWEDAAGVDQMAAGLADLGYEARAVSRADLALMEPALAQPPDRALFFPQEGAVDAAALTRALLAASGAEVLFGWKATGLVLRGDAVSGVQTESGMIEADHVIVAAGTGSAGLLAGVGFDLPMQQRPGVILATRPVARMVHHILAMQEQELRQDTSGRLIAPLAAHHQSDTAERPPQDPQDRVAEALARLNALFNGPRLVVDQVALAYRPVPGDGLPAVGPVMAGLWLAVLHSGVTLGPVVAELLAPEILGHAADPLLLPFRPQRFRD